MFRAYSFNFSFNFALPISARSLLPFKSSTKGDEHRYCKRLKLLSSRCVIFGYVFEPWHGTLAVCCEGFVSWFAQYLSEFFGSSSTEALVGAKDKSSHSCFVFSCSFLPRVKKRIKRTNEGGTQKNKSNEQKWLTPEESITRNRSDHYEGEKKRIKIFVKNSFVPFCFVVSVISARGYLDKEDYHVDPVILQGSLGIWPSRSSLRWSRKRLARSFPEQSLRIQRQQRSLRYATEEAQATASCVVPAVFARADARAKWLRGCFDSV